LSYERSDAMTSVRAGGIVGLTASGVA